MGKNLQMHQEPVFKKWLNAKNYLLALAMMAGVQTNASAQSSEDDLPECKMWAYRNDYLAGTDKNSNYITDYFEEYGISFEVNKGMYSQFGSDLRGFFGKPVIFGNAVLEESDCLFLENPNGIIYTLGYLPVEEMKGKAYRYKMRVYIQAPEDCAKSVAQAWVNASIGVRTEFPSSEYDILGIKAYDSNDNLLVGEDKAIDGVVSKAASLSDGGSSVELSKLFNLDSVALGDIIRLDVEISGKFPEEAGSLESFKLSPVLSQFECTKAAVECIAAEYEAHCISSTTACKGEYVTAHAAGFQQNSSYEWYKKDGNDWVKLEDVSGEGDGYGTVEILVEKAGAARYKVVVSNELAFVGKRELEFNIYGMNCGCNDDSIIKTKLFDHGTDFNPTGSNTGDLDKDVENKFVENDIIFSKGDCDYTITSDENENYFMNVVNPNARIAKFEIPFDRYAGKGYRFAMSAYLEPTCMFDKNAKIVIRTVSGLQKEPSMIVSAYDEVTGEFLGVTRGSLQGDCVVYLSSLLKGKDFPKTDTVYHRLRFDVEYYGMVPDKANGLRSENVTIEVAQFPCSTFSIDYMDFELSDVLIGYDVVCKGETTTAHAAGFPMGTVYTWYAKEESGWQKLGSDIDAYDLNIDVDYVGRKEFKLVADAEGAAPAIIGFSVYGNNCDSIPTNVNSIDTDVNAVVNVYTVDGIVLKNNVKLSEALIDLKKGFYIIGNKKVYVDK